MIKYEANLGFLWNVENAEPNGFQSLLKLEWVEVCEVDLFSFISFL